MILDIEIVMGKLKIAQITHAGMVGYLWRRTAHRKGGVDLFKAMINLNRLVLSQVTSLTFVALQFVD